MKLTKKRLQIEENDVALFVSAWIEIALSPVKRTECPVALFVSAWIEIIKTLVEGI